MSQDEGRYRPGTQQRGEDTRRRILETAIEVFAIEGYDGASTRVLAERAGVNLPAIQYYFGSKEGLYRAAIGHIVAEVDEAMGPAADRAREALAGGDLSRDALLALLFQMLDAFVTLVLGGCQTSRKLLIARAEVEEVAALDPLCKCMGRQTIGPCAELVARLLHRAPDDEQTILRTLAILGQIGIFGHKGPWQAFGRSELGEGQVTAIQALVREHTEAILDTISRTR